MEYKIFESSDTNVKKFVFEWEDDEDYEEINSCIYYSITGYADLPKEGEIIEIDVTLVSPSQQLESKKYIKTRKHK